MHKTCRSSNGAVDGVIRRAADAICNISHENSNIKNIVRIDGGIPPLVELFNFYDTKVQRVAAGALRILAFKNDENKNQIIECNVLPNLVLMMRSEIAAMTYEAAHIVQRGAVQPLIKMLQSPDSQVEEMSAFAIGRLAQDNIAALIRHGLVQKFQY